MIPWPIADLTGALYRDSFSLWFGGACSAFLPRIKDASIDVVWTDPPYGLPMTHDDGSGEKTFGFHLGDDFKTTDAGAVLRASLDECARILTEKGEIFCMTAGPAFADTYQTLEKHGFKLRVLTWDKGSGSPTFPGFAWQSTSELIIYGTRKIDTAFKTHGGKPSVIGKNRCAGKERIKRPEDGKSLHPTQKPLSVIDECLANSRLAILPTGIVLDPFGGTASTLVAARRMGRRAIGMELMPKFAEPAAARLRGEAEAEAEAEEDALRA